MTEDKPAEETEFWKTLTTAINAAPDFHTALSVALLQVGESTTWDYGEAWIPCQEGTFLELSPAWYISTRSEGATMPAFEQFRLCSEDFILPPAIGLPGRVWSSQQPEWILDVSAESETYFLRNQIAKACAVKAGFGIPIVANHQVLAVLVFFMSQAREEDKQVVELLTAVATELGEVLQRLSAVTLAKTSQHF